MQLGIGFNPRYLTGELTCPSNASYLEAGASLLLASPTLPAVFSAIRETSLHLSRAPFCEAPAVQERFAAKLAARLPATVSSVGLHLGGPYATDLGFFGLGTAYLPTPDNERRARHLLELLIDATGRRVLIENANYYDQTLGQAAATLATQNRLCECPGVGLILDLSHLTMGAHNLGVAPDFLLGMIDLEKVAVIHLSGISEGRDGAYHDGHQLPVHPRVWELLDRTLAVIGRPVTLVLEHSDPRWTNANAGFARDWDQLRAASVAPAPRLPAFPIDPDQVAIGYMANVVLPQRLPAVHAELGRPAFDALVRAWAPAYLHRVRSQPQATVVLREDERDFYGGMLHDPVADFVGELQRRAGVETC